VITLPKSGKTIEIEKGLPAKMIKQLDNYLSTHTISNKTASVSPDRLACGTYTTTYWNIENQYKPVAGKYLGIWPTPNVTLAKLHDQMGFTNIVCGIGDTMSAKNAGFKHDSIMVNLGYNATYSDIMNNPAYRFYYVDEPYVRWWESYHDYTGFQYYSDLIAIKNSSAKLLFSDYFWPDGLRLWQHGNGPDIWENYLDWCPNARIMCDQYNANAWGSVHDFWNEYKAYYGIPSRNISNLISMKPDYSADWGDLLNLATPWGMNPIWIYADYGSVTESTVNSFCSIAWETGWLLRQEKQYTTDWKCLSSPCSSQCAWPNKGTWIDYETFYTGESRYVSY
jgi:hypothetical protein